MILDTHVEIIINSRNKNRLINLGYKGKVKDKIKISIEHLSNGSKCKINVMCDNCNKCKKINYLNYNRQTNYCSSKYYCSDCKEIKSKKTCLEKYGVEIPMKTIEVKEKLKKSNIKKYGVENVFQLNKIKEKSKETKIKLYNNRNYNNRKKSKETCLEKYGVENPLLNKIIKEKSNKTCLEKYGVESYMNTDEFREISIEFFNKNKNEILEKTKNTNLKKYGVENVFADYQTQQKIKQTCLDKYGVEHPAQNEEIFLKTQKSRFKIEKYKDTNIYSQGSYERDFLEKFYDKIEIQRANSVIYIFNEKEHYYHPDYYLPKFNLIVEIKSKYIYELEFEQNILKQQACLNEGYNYIFIIDKNYTEIEKLIK
jgi:hypothetical protein